jgi:CRP/FNR family cyclic AMP-dependent transcriptional regulator
MLGNVPLFQGLCEEELNTIQLHAVPKTYRKNTVIIEKGDESTSLYILLDGKVKVYVSDDQGKEIILNTQGPGEYLGELALLGESPRTASVMTLEDSRFLVITKRAFLECLSNNPNIALNLIKGLVRRVSALTESVSNLALRGVYGRLSNTLMEHASEEDGRLVTQRLTQQDIANLVGSSREMVSRIFKDLKAGGYISVEGKRIIINKKLPANW